MAFTNETINTVIYQRISKYFTSYISDLEFGDQFNEFVYVILLR